MKWLLLFLSFSVFLNSRNNSSGSIVRINTPANGISTSGSKNSVEDERGSISCIMDGSPKVFSVSQGFFEISLSVDPNGPKNGLEILQGDAKKEGFQFEFKKTGVSRIKGDGSGDLNCIINYYNSKGITYTGEDVTITLTYYDQKHLTGTFSGKLVNVYFAEKAAAKNYPQYITISDGKFDLRR